MAWNICAARRQGTGFAALLVAVPPVMFSLYTTSTLGDYGETLLLNNLLLLIGWRILAGELESPGWWLLAGFLGGLGWWGVSAQLAGAVVTSGLVTVESNRQAVQHPEGGVVAEASGTPARWA